MKVKYFLTLFAILLSGFLTSCKKSPFSPITGRWYETKLRTYMQDSAGKILYDTTYLHPFTSFDYAQFDSDGRCMIGTDHYYYINSPGYPKTPQQIAPVIANWNYSSIGFQYLLTPQSHLVNPGGFITADTAFIIASDTLLVHSVFYGHFGNSKSVTDSYYKK